MARVKTSFAQQAANRAAFAEAAANLNRVITAAGLATEHALPALGLDLVNRIKRDLKRPGTGRMYRSKVSKAMHRASAPGRPPASDSGDLSTSYRMVVIAPGVIEVGTNIEYAAYLEFGTRKMRPRPHFRPNVNALKAVITAEMASAIVKAEKAAIAGLRGSLRAGILRGQGRAF